MSSPDNGIEPSRSFITTDSLRIYSALMIMWTLLIIVLATLFIRYVDWVYTDLLFIQIRAACDRDLLFRSWCTKFGGVYVPVAMLEPNPWLKHPKRDVTTDKDLSLTLVNPAWMTRQVNEMQQGGDRKIVSRLTSSKLINPNNAPDEWETHALGLFESKTESEAFGIFSKKDGHKIVRLARPLKVTQGCLNCHGDQGYEIDDIRGIISIEVDADEMFMVKRQIQKIIYSISFSIWLIGLITLAFSRQKLKHYSNMNFAAWSTLLTKEETIRHNRDELESMTNDLRKAIEASESANRAKSQFLATMSHEIRTPLSGVIGAADLLLGLTLQPKQLEYARLIKASGESLLFLINDILDFSKIEAEKFELDESEFIVHEVVESVLKILSSKATERKLELIATFDISVPGPVVGDAGRLRQILVNLVSNALKFTNEGGTRIHVALDKLLDDQISLKFSITDTGIGIPEERQDRLFKSFSQVDASTSRVYGGTGLGLAISKKLIELMHGNIYVESKIGQGTTFWFTAQFGCQPRVLKCLRAMELSCIVEKRDYCRGVPPQRCARSGREVAFLQHVTELKGMKILLVGSGSIMIPALIEQIQFWQMNVEGVTSSAEAFKHIKENRDTPFRLIIVDFSPNDTDSESLIRDIQNDDYFKDTAFICLLPLSEDLLPKMWKYPEKIRSVTKPICCSVLLDTVVRSFFVLPDVLFTSSHVNTDIMQSVRVLAVDDNLINRIVITEILKSAGAECVVVESGIAAIDRIKKELFDIVLMDCQMPIMDGYETTEAIRQWEKDTENPTRLPIVALTANVTPEDIQRCFEAGMDAYCSKPINPTALFKEMKWLLEENAT